jgi:hypothetical protein
MFLKMNDELPAYKLYDLWGVSQTDNMYTFYMRVMYRQIQYALSRVIHYTQSKIIFHRNPTVTCIQQPPVSNLFFGR